MQGTPSHMLCFSIASYQIMFWMTQSGYTAPGVAVLYIWILLQNRNNPQNNPRPTVELVIRPQRNLHVRRWRNQAVGLIPTCLDYSIYYLVRGASCLMSLQPSPVFSSRTSPPSRPVSIRIGVFRHGESAAGAFHYELAPYT